MGRARGLGRVLAIGNTIGNTMSNSIAIQKNKGFEKCSFELNMKQNNLIKGFPGVLNTLGTLLDRSRTIKYIFKKTPKMEGPIGPRGLGPKKHESHKE